MTTSINTSTNTQTLCTSILQQYPSINHILLLCLCCEQDPEYFTQYNAEQLDTVALSLRNDKDWANVCQATSFQNYAIENNDHALPSVLLNIKALNKSDGFRDAIDHLLREDSKIDHQEEIYTPPSIASLIARLMQPQANESIYDPTCGAGSLLTACGKLAKVEVFGQEALLKRWVTSQLTLMLYRQNPLGIKHSDCLLQPLHQENQLQKFDVVIGVPPLGRLVKNMAINDDFQRFKWGMPPSRLDYAYISHMVSSMCPENGRMAVLAQHGVLFRSAMEASIRQKLIEDNLLDAVIALPEKMIPFMSAPLVLLIFKQQRPDTNVLWIDASKDYIADKYQNKLGKKHINRICELYINRQTVSQQATLVSFEEIKHNQFKLNIPLYIQPEQKVAPSDLQSLQQERKQLIQQWQSLQEQLDDILQSQ
ncbi:N-6 DNA methylase [Ghiorsea bivora]|uniref:N-6 DNA methylase n=1 Tax=Ghiorsea bivora TaxID=1485545 RepID=UPI00068FB313|nr:N-6 DNA methylase [Ghiorsea bivora]